MPLFYLQEISLTTKLAIWKIEEPESFFLSYVPLQSDIKHPHKRLQHLAGRYLLQYLFPDFPIHDIQIASTRKPFLQDEQYHFSISHCGNYAAAIVSATHRIGIDIEIERITVAKVAHKFLNEEEIETFIRPNSPLAKDIKLADLFSQSLSILTLLWCAKEAIFKWWGSGEVDFSEMIRIKSVSDLQETQMAALFVTPKVGYQLFPEFKVFNELSLVWVVGNK